MINISSPNLPSSGTFGAFKPPLPKKKSILPYLIIGAAVLSIAIGYYIFVYQKISFHTSLIPVAPPLTSVEVKVSQLPNFNFDVFNSPFYKSLKTYGALPVTADSLGRTNPFIPY